MSEEHEKLAGDQQTEKKSKRGSRLTVCIICALLVLITIAVYWQVYKFDFMSMDDVPYVVHNPMVSAGLAPAAIQRAFALPYDDNYIPLV